MNVYEIILQNIERIEDNFSKWSLSKLQYEMNRIARTYQKNLIGTSAEYTTNELKKALQEKNIDNVIVKNFVEFYEQISAKKYLGLKIEH